MTIKTNDQDTKDVVNMSLKELSQLLLDIQLRIGNLEVVGGLRVVA
jgi:hypothetical protein